MQLAYFFKYAEIFIGGVFKGLAKFKRRRFLCTTERNLKLFACSKRMRGDLVAKSVPIDNVQSPYSRLETKLMRATAKIFHGCSKMFNAAGPTSARVGSGRYR